MFSVAPSLYAVNPMCITYLCQRATYKSPPPPSPVHITPLPNKAGWRQLDDLQGISQTFQKEKKKQKKNTNNFYIKEMSEFFIVINT